MKLPADFREFIELMIAANVKFVMIGATRTMRTETPE